LRIVANLCALFPAAFGSQSSYGNCGAERPVKRKKLTRKSDVAGHVMEEGPTGAQSSAPRGYERDWIRDDDDDIRRLSNSWIAL
jgi:hypothetical protein